MENREGVAQACGQICAQLAPAALVAAREFLIDLKGDAEVVPGGEFLPQRSGQAICRAPVGVVLTYAQVRSAFAQGIAPQVAEPRFVRAARVEEQADIGVAHHAGEAGSKTVAGEVQDAAAAPQRPRNAHLDGVPVRKVIALEQLLARRCRKPQRSRREDLVVAEGSVELDEQTT